MGSCVDGRYAAIDIGTVTCRMLVADVRAGRVVPVAKEYAITNLGEGVDATGVLLDAAMERVAETVDRYLHIRDEAGAAGVPVRKTLAMATSAARDAKNADMFAALLRERGLELAVIPGEKEAALSFRGASSEFAGETLLVVDVGGGSTELIVGAAGADPLAAHSFDIGCRRVTEHFLQGDPPVKAELDDARVWMRAQFEAWLAALPAGVALDRMVAVAGTATTAVSIREAMEVYDSECVHGAVVTLDELRRITARLARLPLEQRAQVTGLDPGRAPVIVAGMVILEEVMRAAGVEAFTVSESDILQGIILEIAKG